jgi:sporulation integral membrane protein YtvI
MNILNPRLVHQIFRGIWVAIIITVVGYTLFKVTPLVYPFIFGWIIAYLLNPLVNLLQRRVRLPRWLAVTISMLLFFSIAATCVTLLVANIIVEAGALSETLQNLINIWVEKYNAFVHSPEYQNLVKWVNDFYEKNPQSQDTINNNLTSTASTLADFIKQSIGYIMETVLSLLRSLPNIATLAIIALLATFFISKDWYRIITRYSGIFSEAILRITKLIRIDLQHALFGYFRAQLILVSLTALVVIIGLLVLRVDYAITIGLLTGLADLLPYLGTGAVMVPWILYVFFVEGNIYLGIGLSILYGVIVIARQIMEPKVLASSVGLDPLATLISLFVGLKLFGLVGLIIGPVTLVVISAFHRAGVFRNIAQYVQKGSMSE